MTMTTKTRQKELMPDTRQAAIDRAVQVLREAGVEMYSIIATWPGNDTRSAMMFPRVARINRHWVGDSARSEELHRR